MVKKSEGNFIYLRYVIPEMEGGAYKESTLQALPAGLNRRNPTGFTTKALWISLQSLKR
jgi:hypothetical protein